MRAAKRASSTSAKPASWPRASGEFEVGTRIWLMLPGRERANALVRWVAGDKIGAEFAEPISLDGLEGKTRRSNCSPPSFREGRA